VPVALCAPTWWRQSSAPGEFARSRGLWREEAVAAFKAEYELLSVENAQASFCESMLAS